MPEKCCKNCESCLMPFDKDPGQRESDKYCSYCFKDGKLTYEGGLKEFREICYKGMRQNGMNPIVAWFFSHMVRFAPRWKNKSKKH